MAPVADLRDELNRRQSNTDAVLALFQSRPNEWIDWTELAAVGGALAWRTRVADARKAVQATGGRIENRQRRNRALERDPEGAPQRLYLGPIISEYRYVVTAVRREKPAKEAWPTFDTSTPEPWGLT